MAISSTTLHIDSISANLGLKWTTASGTNHPGFITLMVKLFFSKLWFNVFHVLTRWGSAGFIQQRNALGAVPLWSEIRTSIPTVAKSCLPFCRQVQDILRFCLAFEASFRFQGTKRAGNRFIAARRGTEWFTYLINWKLSFYFCCILAKILSITSVTVIKAPTRV